MLPMTAFAAGSSSSSKIQPASDGGVALNGRLTGIGGNALLAQPALQVASGGSKISGGVIDGAPAVDANNPGIAKANGNNLDSGNGGQGADQGGDQANGGHNADESEIDNKQVNTDTVWNNTNVETDNVNGDVNASASATANAFQALTFNNTVVNNDQYASGAAVGSDLNAMVTNVNGSVNLGNTVACNTADVSTDPAYTVVNSKQECAVGDPSQATNVFVAQVQNDVNVSGAVAANVYTEDTNAKYNYVNTNQINSSAVNSTTNVQSYNVGGSVNVSSSAVGNTAQIVHY
jgi:hypothetical protein